MTRSRTGTHRDHCRYRSARCHRQRPRPTPSLAAGELDLVDLQLADYARAAELVQQYADFPLGAVDAFVVAVAERLDVAEIATLDRRHFSVVRPKHVTAFTLLPN